MSEKFSNFFLTVHKFFLQTVEDSRMYNKTNVCVYEIYLYSTFRYSSVLFDKYRYSFNTFRYSSVQFSTVRYCSVQFSTVFSVEFGTAPVQFGTAPVQFGSVRYNSVQSRYSIGTKNVYKQRL